MIRLDLECRRTATEKLNHLKLIVQAQIPKTSAVNFSLSSTNVLIRLWLHSQRKLYSTLISTISKTPNDSFLTRIEAHFKNNSLKVNVTSPITNMSHVDDSERLHMTDTRHNMVSSVYREWLFYVIAVDSHLDETGGHIIKLLSIRWVACRQRHCSGAVK